MRCALGIAAAEEGAKRRYHHLQQAAIVRCIAFMSNSLGEGPWCIGNHFGLADIAVGCALGYLELRFPDLDWRGAHPNLGKLYDKLMQRASFAETAPPVG